jgi:protein-S-isoprenylcysteine O-methyltransferase Ste14
VLARPYRVLRHPSEVGLLAIAAGTALLLGSVVAAIGTLVLVPLARARIAQEESCLE